MKEVLYNRDNVMIAKEFGDIALYTKYLMVVKPDTPENRKKIFDIAGVKM